MRWMIDQSTDGNAEGRACPPRAERRRRMNARIEREISEIIDDLTGFVAEVRREHGEEDAHEFVDLLLIRIGDMQDDGELEREA